MSSGQTFNKICRVFKQTENIRIDYSKITLFLMFQISRYRVSLKKNTKHYLNFVNVFILLISRETDILQ